MDSLAVLRCAIPFGGFGRPLTRVERADLRRLGYDADVAVRAVSDRSDLGVAYWRRRSGALAHAGVPLLEAVDGCSHGETWTARREVA